MAAFAKSTERSSNEEKGWRGYWKMNGLGDKCMQARAGQPPLYTALLPWHQNRRGKHLFFVKKPNLICTFQQGVNIFELSHWARGGLIRFSRETAPSRISSLLHCNFTFQTNLISGLFFSFTPLPRSICSCAPLLSRGCHSLLSMLHVIPAPGVPWGWSLWPSPCLTGILTSKVLLLRMGVCLVTNMTLYLCFCWIWSWLSCRLLNLLIYFSTFLFSHSLSIFSSFASLDVPFWLWLPAPWSCLSSLPGYLMYYFSLQGLRVEMKYGRQASTGMLIFCVITSGWGPGLSSVSINLCLSLAPAAFWNPIPPMHRGETMTHDLSHR